VAPRGINDPWLPEVEQLARKLLSKSSNVLKAGAQKPAQAIAAFSRFRNNSSGVKLLPD
jgi:hypothetical protein